ncbi:MAG TPA: Yip1 family protein [Allosphingosinicella sp.]|jgi:hypothetical protein
MNLVQRAINILTNPKAEWPRIDAEPATAGGLMTGYALPLALIPAVITVIGGLLFTGMMGPFAGAGIVYLLVLAVLGLVLGLAILYVMSLIADALAPNFGGVKNPIGALKLLVYSGTAVWVASIFSIIPVLGWLIALLGYVYAAYLIYLGSIAVMKVPQSSAAGYTAVVILIWIVLGVVVSFIIGLIVAAAFLSTAVSTIGNYRY